MYSKTYKIMKIFLTISRVGGELPTPSSKTVEKIIGRLVTYHESFKSVSYQNGKQCKEEVESTKRLSKKATIADLVHKILQSGIDVL